MHWLWNLIGISSNDRSLERIVGENGKSNIVCTGSFPSVNIDACQGGVDASKSQLELSLEKALVFELNNIIK